MKQKTNFLSKEGTKKLKMDLHLKRSEDMFSIKHLKKQLFQPDRILN